MIEFNFLLIILFRLFLVLVSVALFITSIFLIKKYHRKFLICSIILIIVAVLNVFFMFFYNDSIKSPLGSTEIDCSKLYEPMVRQSESEKDYLNKFSTDYNFSGSYSVTAGKDTFNQSADSENVNENGDCLYFCKPNIKASRDSSLLFVADGYTGVIYIYNKADDITVSIYYEMILKAETDRFFNVLWYTSTGVNDKFSLDNIKFYQ